MNKVHNIALQSDKTRPTGVLAHNVIDRWLLGIMESNPAILDMFRQRELRPYRDMLPWSGEFAGKYLTSTGAVYRLTQREDLLEYGLLFARQLAGCMGEDGYLGCFQKDCRLTGAYSQNPGSPGATWDAWGHYHAMTGFCDWFELTGESWLLEAAERIAGLFVSTFYTGKKKLSDMLSPVVNLSPYHSMARLSRLTGNKQYLEFAKQVEQDLATAMKDSDYLTHALAGMEYFQNAQPRWEALHIVMGFAEMARITGQERYRTALLQVFDSIRRTDVHNTGAFSTREAAIGTPFVNEAIETCCVVAYQALAVEALYLSGRCDVADQLESAHYNAILGSFSPSGRWSTYNTPMDGVRNANFHDIHFQCRPGSPELNCCSVNAPRAIGLFADWAITEDEKGTYINTYEPLKGRSSHGVSVAVEGAYPAPGQVRVTAVSDTAADLLLRIPAWSKHTRVLLDGQTILPVAGEYLALHRRWQGETIDLQFDFTPYTTDGGGEYQDKKSIYCGPLLLGCDLADNGGLDWDNLPAVSMTLLQKTAPITENGAMGLRLPNGMVLRPFADLGWSGSRYKTWLAVTK